MGTKGCTTSALPSRTSTPLAEAQANGATLKECAASKITGSHIHPEGWVVLLQDSVSGIEIEFMQVYKEGEGATALRV